MNEEIYMNPGPLKKRAADYRRIAREKLKKYYWIVLAVVLVAGLLGGTVSSYGSAGPSFSVSVGAPVGVDNESTTPDGGTDSVIPEGSTDSGATDEDAITFDKEALWFAIGFTIVFFAFFLLVFLVIIAFDLLVGAPVSLGLQRFLLNVMDEENLNFPVLFSYFKICYGKAILLRLLRNLILFASNIPFTLSAMGGFVCIVLGLLFMAQPVLLYTGIGLVICSVPLSFLSIVISYRYFFAETILAEYPDMRPIDALRNSAQIMKGNKWRLFCLNFSFFGWALLAAFCTCGLGSVFLAPYTQTADVAFYDDITNRRAARETEFPSIDPDDYITVGE